MDPQPRRARRPKVVLAAPFFIATLAISLIIVSMASGPPPSDPIPRDVDAKTRKDRADEIIKKIESMENRPPVKTPEAPKLPPAPKTLTPVFAWPQDLTFEVDYSKLIRMRNRFVPVERMRYKFDAPSQEGGTRVLRISDLIRLKPSGEVLTEDGALHLIKQQGLGELLPAASIDASGKMLQPNTSPALVSRARELLFGSPDPKASPDSNRVSEKVIAYRTTLLWDTLAAHWSGKTWKQGEERVVELQGLAPTLGVLDAPIEHRAKFTYRGGAWCDPVKEEGACVAFEMVLAASPKAAAQAMKRALESTGDGAQAKVEQIELAERHTVITDAATLIPRRHTIDTLLSFTATISLPDKPGEPHKTRAETRVERVYRRPVDKALTSP